MNSIITVSNFDFKSPSFRNESLNQATQRIASIISDAMVYAETKNREIASILSTIKSEQSYKEDGFESVADYAEMIFGIKRGNAYALASAGDIYNDPTASDKIKSLSPHKLAELSKVPTATIESDLNSGKISAETTLKDLREYKNSVLSSDSKKDTVVLDEYDARPVSGCMVLPEALTNLLTGSHVIEEWNRLILDHIDKNGRFSPEVIKLTKAPALVSGKPTKKRTVERRLYVTHDFCLCVEFTKHSTNAKLEKKPKFTKAELMAMMAELEEDEDMEDADMVDSMESDQIEENLLTGENQFFQEDAGSEEV